jgi:hypothetical protein
MNRRSFVKSAVALAASSVAALLLWPRLRIGAKVVKSDDDYICGIDLPGEPALVEVTYYCYPDPLGGLDIERIECLHPDGRLEVLKPPRRGIFRGKL